MFQWVTTCEPFIYIKIAVFGGIINHSIHDSIGPIVRGSWIEFVSV